MRKTSVSRGLSTHAIARPMPSMTGLRTNGRRPVLISVEHDGGVGGHAGDEGRIGETVKVREVEFLHGGILRQAQSDAKPLANRAAYRA